MLKGQKPHTIKRADVFKVAKWLDAHWPEIETHRPTMDDVAKRLSTDLELAVSWVNVRNIVRDLGKRWPRGASGIAHNKVKNTMNRKLELVTRELIKVIELLTIPNATRNFNADALRAILSHAPIDEILEMARSNQAESNGQR